MATKNNTTGGSEYFNFVQDLTSNIQNVEALLWGAQAIHDRIMDDNDLNHIYMSELMIQIREQMAKLRGKIDGSTFRYISKQAEQTEKLDA